MTTLDPLLATVLAAVLNDLDRAAGSSEDILSWQLSPLIVKKINTVHMVIQVADLHYRIHYGSCTLILITCVILYAVNSFTCCFFIFM